MAPSQPLNNRKKIEKKYSKELQLFLEKAKINAHEIPTTQITPSYFIYLIVVRVKHFIFLCYCYSWRFSFLLHTHPLFREHLSRFLQLFLL